MRFCALCDNMLYISLRSTAAAGTGAGAEAGKGTGAPRLTYVCKHCGNVAEAAHDEEGGATRVMLTNYADDQTTYQQHATRFIKFDPTLPRVSNIPCPNAECKRPKAAAQRVIYVKYDYANLKYLYCCEHCDTFWKSGDNMNGVVFPPTAAATTPAP
jgi:hypothetical protein